MTFQSAPAKDVLRVTYPRSVSDLQQFRGQYRNSAKGRAIWTRHFTRPVIRVKIIRNLTQKAYIWLAFCVAGLVLVSGGRVCGSDFDLAETADSMRIWRSGNGLLSDSVTAILQTRDGFLWAGTSAGVVRFDGVKFTELSLAATATNSTVHVTALGEDSDGHLWIGTEQDGLFEQAQGEVRHFTTAAGLLDDSVTSLATDGWGMVWIGTKSGLNLWNGKDFKSFTTADGLPDKYVSGVNVARSGTVWITTRIGMCRILGGHITPYAFQTESQGRSPEYLGAYEDRRGNLWAFGDTYLINLEEGKRFNYFRNSDSASVRIWSLCEGQDGRLWIGTSDSGLLCFEDNRFQPVVLGGSRWSYDVRAICEDREGNLWLGTSGGGLVQLRPQSEHILRSGQGLPSGTPTALAQDAGGRIYVGLQHGGLLVGESGRFDRAGSGDGLMLQGSISSVCAARDGTVWAGTLGDGLYGLKNGREVHFTTTDGLADDDVLAVGVDAEGSLWAGTGAGTVHCFTGRRATSFDTAQGLPGAPVTALIPAAAGGLWLGTLDGRILREEKGKFNAAEPSPDRGRDPVLALYEGEQNRLWIGTAGAGLACLARGGEMDWTTNSGLPSGVVAGVVEDQAKNLWLATGSGIYQVSRSDVRKSLEDRRLPLACKLMSEVRTAPEFSTFTGGCRALLSSDGDLWFATSEGVLNVAVHQSANIPSVFPVCLESALFNGGPPISLLRGALWSPTVAPGGTLIAPGDLRSLEIHFTALSYALPEEIQFRHKLEGFDLDWVEGSTRSVHYDRLPYGHYHFEVAARTPDGNWLPAAETFDFEVPTPLYIQTWAIILYVLAAVALVAGIVRIVSHRRLRFTLARLEQQQSLERERMRIARDMHDEMGSKLTKISFLSEHAQVDAQASGPLADKIESIAQTSRDLLKTMDEIVWVVNPRNDTLENLTAYLAHYAVEYFQNTSIECELRLPQEIPHYALSSETRHNLFLTFEETLNNVLKHSGATNVKVEMTIKALEFELKVTDNGKGFAEAAAATARVPARGGRGGNGLKNMRQRLAALGGECLVASQPGTGATVTMRFRLTKK